MEEQRARQEEHVRQVEPQDSAMAGGLAAEGTNNLTTKSQKNYKNKKILQAN